MGILDKIFGPQDSSEDDKYVLYMNLALNLIAVDGDQSDDEMNKFFDFFRSIPGMTESRYERIHNRVVKQDGPLSYIDKINEDEKFELINFLIDLANSDGYFHGEECAYIILLAMMLKLDVEKLYDFLNTNYLINQAELEVATERLKENFKAHF